MRDEHFQMIDLYLESERIRYYHELELYKQEILEDFFRYHEQKKGEDFRLEELTAPERKDYTSHLLGDMPVNTIVFARGKLRVVESFLAFLAKTGLISSNPWGGA